MKKIVLITFAILIFVFGVFGQISITKNTLRLKKDAKAEKGTVSDVEWLTGSWTGKGLGGDVTEVWTKTGGGGMIGTFSLVKKGKPVFYEFMQMTIENEHLVLKIKHFNPNMVGWEEKDKTVDFKFIKKEKNRVYFRGLTFEKVGENELNIYLALKKKDKPYTEAVFNFKRLNE